MTEEKVQYEVEIPVKASPHMLFPYLSTPSGLSEWFADEERSAKRLAKKTDKFIRFRWEEDEEEGLNYFFEFKIIVDELTQDASLIVIDHSEPDEVEEDKRLWESQVHELLHTIGA